MNKSSAFMITVIGIFTMLIALMAADESACGGTKADKDVGAKILADAKITQPSDIECAVICFKFRGTYKITQKTDPDKMILLYEALHSIVSIPDMMSTGAGNELELCLKSGKSIGFAFEERPDETQHPPQSVFLTEIYHSKELATLFHQIKRDPKAAARDAKIGDYSVASVEAQAPGGKLTEIISTSPGYEAVLVKTKTLIDWLDLRNVGARVVTCKEVEEMGSQRGIVHLTLSEPIDITFSVALGIPGPSGFPNPFVKTGGFERVIVDRISVVGEPTVPRIIFRERYLDRCYMSNFYLMHRDEERYGVLHYGLPGHCPKDEDYYKKPAAVFKELMDTVKLATAPVSKEKGGG